MIATLADGNSPHDLYFFEQPQEMLAGDVTPPGLCVPPRCRRNCAPSAG
jgi:hypothetical protein